MATHLRMAKDLHLPNQVTTGYRHPISLTQYYLRAYLICMYVSLCVSVRVHLHHIIFTLRDCSCALRIETMRSVGPCGD